MYKRERDAAAGTIIAVSANYTADGIRGGRIRGIHRRSAARGGPAAKPAGRPPNMAALRLRRAFWSRSLQKRNGSAASTPKWWSSSRARRARSKAWRRAGGTCGRGGGAERVVGGRSGDLLLFSPF